ncbi:MAG TPA: PEP-CTERM sorting domain-containing protein [Fimbriimonadaceae bacterium]|nr:PEP-CTERM sorting domain-containing protein [Fimbriimonadaceae bacterium]
MVRSLVLGGIAATLIGSAGMAQALTLVNGDIENNSTGQFGAIAGWGPNGGWALHSGFPAPGNGGLGNSFGFYSAGTTETVGQIVQGHTIQANTTYKFWGWAYKGGDNLGTIPWQLGYANTDGQLNSFVALATTLNVVDGATEWAEMSGVSYTTGTSGAELGRQLIVRFGSGANGGASDIWFDNLQASAEVVPEPATMVALSLGAAAMLRRRRK